MSDIFVRAAAPNDVPQILQMIKDLAEYEKEPDAVLSTSADLHEALFGSAKSQVGASAAYAVVAEHESGEIMGFALWFLNYSTWLGKHGIYLEDLYVKPEHRGSGAGKALLRRLAQICVERGYGRLEWWVLDWNTPAIDFYKAKGAKAMDEWTVYRVTGAALEELAE